MDLRIVQILPCSIYLILVPIRKQFAQYYANACDEAASRPDHVAQFMISCKWISEDF